MPESVEGSTEPTEQPVVEQSQAETSTPEPEAQATSDDSFTESSVPVELEPLKKQLQADYTRKMQAIAEERKQIDAYKQKAEAYEKYQQHIPIVEEMLKNQSQTVESPELKALEDQYRKAGYSEEAIDMMKMGIGFALNHVNQTTTQRQEVERITSSINEAAKVDPRLTDPKLVYQTDDGESVTYGQMVEQLVEATPGWQSDPVAATKKAINRIDALIGKAKTEGKEELSSAAKAKAQKFPATQSSPQATSDAEVSGSIREIGMQVMKELGSK